ncbi:MAG: DNA polymerase I [Patescibacteria group bacterium]|nr:DNA polymerase I [Patescibacteria group bacterium]
MKKNAPKFIIIDGNALIHRSFHAIPPTLTTKDGLLVNAVYGFTNFILKAFIELKPEFVVLTLDRPAPTFRHEEYVEYKATRTKAPDELYEQIPLVKEVAQALDIPIFEKDGFEADDLIGTITKESEKETDWQNIIITGDMDTLQLISDRTSVYTMSHGLSDSVLYGAEEVKARYGLRPDQIVDYKALRGDASDNIPGVKGIGEKSATELLQAFTTLDGIYQAAEKNNEKIKARTRELLLQDKDNAYLSQRLATINREVPIKIRWDSFKLDSFDENEAEAVFQKLEFRSLLSKLKQIKNLGTAGKEEAEDKRQAEYQDKFARNQTEKKYQLISDDNSFNAFFKKLQKQSAFAIDTETEGLNPLKAQLLGLSFSWQAGEAYYLHLGAKTAAKADLFNYRQEEAGHDWLKRLQTILEDRKIQKYGHNLKFDWRILKNQGINLQGIAFDSLLASYLLNPDNRQHGLDGVSFRELAWEKISTEELIGKGKDAIAFSQVQPEKMAQYAGEDADCAWQLQTVLGKKLKKEKLDKLFTNLELPLITVLGDMEENGIKLDPKPLNQLSKKLEKRLSILTKEAYRLGQEEFNLNSPKQLQHILFDNLQLDSRGLKKTKTGISTADDELEKLSGQHEIIALIQEYRELSKLQNTYVLALPGMINTKDGRIHTSYNQSVAATGRLSSTDPNLQNIPTRTEEGLEIRAAFVAAEGYSLLSLDYSQIELRLAAHLSQDKKMMAAFKNNEDIHIATAAAVNGVDLKDVSKEMRRAAKAVNFGILYGQGPHGLSQGAGISYGEAKDFIDRYLEVYPGIKKMMDKFIADARNKGYAETLFGRRRPLPDLNADFAQVRRAAERMAINMPIQGTAADMIKKAMLDIADYIKDKKEEIRLLLQVHDELIFEIKSDKLKQHVEPLKKLMAEALPLSVPVIVEAASGQNWGELK